MPKVSVVTGGCGFLGRHVVRRLLDEGKRVVIVDDRSTPGSDRPLPGGAEFIEANLAYESTMAPWDRLTLGQEVEEVWHLASPASPAIYKRRRVDTLRLHGEVLHRILSWASANGARVFYASSSEVYGDPEHATQVETDPARFNPVGERSCYDAAKAYGEAVCAAWAHEQPKLEVRIARIFNTYGPGQSGRDGRLVPTMIRAALEGRPFTIHADGSQTRTLGYVEDTVAGMLAVMRAGPTFRARPVNVGGTWSVRVLDLVGLVRETVGDFPVEFGPPQDADDPRRRRPNLDLLRSLGWEAGVDLPSGIRWTADWMRANTD